MYAQIQLLVMICSGVSPAVKEKELLQVSLSLSLFKIMCSFLKILYSIPCVCLHFGRAGVNFPNFVVFIFHTSICKLAYLMAPITTIAYNLCLVGV